MARRLMTTDQILAVLRETPDRLKALTHDLNETELRLSPEPGEWSVKEILAHLRSCADVWGAAMEETIVTEHPTIRAVNPTTWIESTDYHNLQFMRSLQLFTRQRDRLLDLLRNLSNADWSRTATVLGARKPLELTVRSYADRLARHERTHWKQVARTVGALRN